MTDIFDEKKGQLSLNLSCPNAIKNEEAVGSKKVVSFVDPITLSVRREALRRVQAAGIFVTPEIDVR